MLELHPESRIRADLGEFQKPRPARRDLLVAAPALHVAPKPQALAAAAFGGGLDGLVVTTPPISDPAHGLHLESALTVLQPDAAGVFQSVAAHRIGGYAVGVAAADLGGGVDVADIVVVCDRQVVIGPMLAPGYILVLRNKRDGSGTFEAPSLVTFFASNTIEPRAMALGRFRGAMALDIAVLHKSGVTIWPGNGDGTFGAAFSDVPFAGGHSLAVGDFNGDGRDDLAVSTSAGVSLLLSVGDGSFAVAPSGFPPPPPGDIPSIAVGRLRGPGQPLDLLVSWGQNQSYRVDVFRGNGDGTFASLPAHALAVPSLVRDIAVAQLTGEGAIDVVVHCWGSPGTSPDPTVAVFAGEAGGGLEPLHAHLPFETVYPLPPMICPAGMVVGRFAPGQLPGLALANNDLAWEQSITHPGAPYGTVSLLRNVLPRLPLGAVTPPLVLTGVRLGGPDPAALCAVGAPLVFTASTASTAAVEYRFWSYAAPGDAWTLAQGWSGAAQFTLRPARAGGCRVAVEMRGAGSTSAYGQFAVSARYTVV